MKPVLILDCDGVIMEFIGPFAIWAERQHGIRLTMTGPTFRNSLSRVDDGSPVDDARIPVLLHGFFEEGLYTQTPVAGVQAAIDGLAQAMDVLILTNLPDQYRRQRVESLGQYGFDLPVFTNEGPKGTRVRELAGGRSALFVDDLHAHHRSAALQAPHVARLHMVGDPSLAPMVPMAATAHIRIDNWADAGRWIGNRMKGLN